MRLDIAYKKENNARGSIFMNGRGRMNGPKAGGPGGSCICPNCGYRTSHSRGNPCYNKKCPKCGTQMTRE